MTVAKNPCAGTLDLHTAILWLPASAVRCIPQRDIISPRREISRRGWGGGLRRTCGSIRRPRGTFTHFMPDISGARWPRTLELGSARKALPLVVKTILASLQMSPPAPLLRFRWPSAERCYIENQPPPPPSVIIGWFLSQYSLPRHHARAPAMSEMHVQHMARRDIIALNLCRCRARARRPEKSRTALAGAAGRGVNCFDRAQPT